MDNTSSTESNAYVYNFNLKMIDNNYISNIFNEISTFLTDNTIQKTLDSTLLEHIININDKINSVKDSFKKNYNNNKNIKLYENYFYLKLLIILIDLLSSDVLLDNYNNNIFYNVDYENNISKSNYTDFKILLSQINNKEINDDIIKKINNFFDSLTLKFINKSVSNNIEHEINIYNLLYSYNNDIEFNLANNNDEMNNNEIYNNLYQKISKNNININFNYLNIFIILFLIIKNIVNNCLNVIQNNDAAPGSEIINDENQELNTQPGSESSNKPFNPKSFPHNVKIVNCKNNSHDLLPTTGGNQIKKILNKKSRKNRKSRKSRKNKKSRKSRNNKIKNNLTIF